MKDGYVAGIDFPEGTYDLSVNGNGRGMVEVSYNNRNEDALGFLGIMGNDEHELSYFRNVEFIKGTLIEVTDVEIMLVPSVRNSLVRN